MRINLADIQIERSLLENNMAAVAEKLRQYGVLVVPGMWDSETTTQLGREFESMLNSTAAYIRKVDYSNGRAVTVRMDGIEADVFPATSGLFRMAMFDRFTKLYLGREDVHANDSVYLVNDVVGTKHQANDLHFDIQRSLKFFVYLTDTTVKNGAFACVPGSHKIANEMRLRLGRKLNYDNRELSRQLPVKEEDAIALEGTAGSLIIFDTEVFHRAGVVTAGERRVMRGQSNFVDALNYPGEQGGGKSFLKKLFGK